MNVRLHDLKKLHNKGMSLIYLHPKSKRPLESGWTKQKKKSWDELENSFEPSYNVGVRLGLPSKLSSGNYLGAIDCDVKSTSRKAKLEMNEALRKLGINLDETPIVMSGRGNGSKHIYVQTKTPMVSMKYSTSTHLVKVKMQGETRAHSKKEMGALSDKERADGFRIRAAWEISFMGTGAQTVLPPSIHPDTGYCYHWANPLTVKFLPIFKTDGFDQKRHNIGNLAQNAPGSFKAEEVDLWGSKLPLNLVKMIVDGSDCNDRSAGLLISALSMCRHQFTDNQILSVLSDPNNWIAQTAYDHTGSSLRSKAVSWLSRYTLQKARFETDIMRRFENPPEREVLSEKEIEAESAEIENDHKWQHDLQKTKGDGYKSSLTNIELILSHMVNEKVFIHNSFSTRDSYGMDTGWGGKTGDHLTDIDIVKIRRWLSGSSYAIEPGKEITLDAVKLIADRNKIHPVREWLESLEWDGENRISTWMKDYLKAQAPEPYLSEVSRIFLLAMVKRVFEPGCQWDYTIVLEGNQGTYKSTTARVLAGDKWFMDNLPDLRDKDAMLNLQGKWVIELGELADVKRGDYNAVKAYLNRRADTVRSPYGMLQKDIPRQNVFIGTVNEGEYLKDPTGNRRFWPVRVGVCDVDGLSKVRSQLFAEAMWVYQNCFDGKLMMGERANKQAGEAQKDRRISDDSTEMEEAMYEFIEKNRKKPISQKFDFNRFKVRELFTVGGPWFDWSGKGWAFNNAAQVLANMGFCKRKIRGQRIWSTKEYYKRGHKGIGRGITLGWKNFC